jgi:hypothetical protein
MIVIGMLGRGRWTILIRSIVTMNRRRTKQRVDPVMRSLG